MLWGSSLPLIAELSAEQPGASVSLADRSVAEALLRLPDFDLQSRPDLLEKVDRYLRANQGTTRYFQIVRQFELKDRSDEDRKSVV